MLDLAIDFWNFDDSNFDSGDSAFKSLHKLLLRNGVMRGIGKWENNPAVRFRFDHKMLYMVYPDNIPDFENDKVGYTEARIAWPDRENFAAFAREMVNCVKRKVCPWLDDLAINGEISKERISQYDRESISSQLGYNKSKESWANFRELYSKYPDLANYVIDREFILPIRNRDGDKFPKIKRTEKDGVIIYQKS